MMPSQRALPTIASPGALTLHIAMHRLQRLVRRALARYRQYRKAAAVREELGALDERMLHDLGLSRDEITSVAAEVSDRAERTRLQALHLPPGAA